jgi:hypothetical protein
MHGRGVDRRRSVTSFVRRLIPILLDQNVNRLRCMTLTKTSLTLSSKGENRDRGSVTIGAEHDLTSKKNLAHISTH